MTDPTPETWRPIAGYEGLYEVSDHGRVRRSGGGTRAPAGWVLYQRRTGRGYAQVLLWRNGNRRLATVHRLVLQAYVGSCPEGHVCNHRNGIKTDNRLVNLEWATQSENALHAFRTGLRRSPSGEKAGPGRLTTEQIAEIRSLSESNPAIARRYGLSKSYVWRIRNGKVRTDE